VTAPDQVDRATLMSQIGEADGLIIRSATRADAALLAAAQRLKVIARAGAGVDNVDIEAANQRGIVVMNTPGGNTIAAAEHTFGLMLALLRHLPAAHESMRAGRWERQAFMGVELRGKTLGIIGLGRIGKAVAKRARAFEMTVIAYDSDQSEAEVQAARELGVEMVPLAEVYARSDVITLHPSLNDQTRGLINVHSLAQMKRGVYLVNTARGALIVDSDLADALRSGQVAGAALDVYTEEPPRQDHPLIGLPNVVHTPHLAASTVDAQIAVAVEAAHLVADALLRGQYRNVVNPEILGQVHTR